MKKKFLSLLLSVALVVTTVSIGFSGIVASASAIGAEAITTFRIEDTKEYAYGDSSGNFSTQIKIKNTVSGYKLVVKSLSATFLHPSSTKTVSVVDTANQVVNGASIQITSEAAFNVSGTLSAGEADAIRYTCTYDLYTTAGALLYSDLTGYGYSYASYDQTRKGVMGTVYGTPPSLEDTSFGRWDTLNSDYVDTYPSSLTAGCTTDGYHSGGNYPITCTGNRPATLSITSPLNFPKNTGWTNINPKTSTYTWWTMTAPTSDFYNFSLTFNGSTTQTISIYYMVGTDRTNCKTALTNALASCKQKKYYTNDSWNSYLNALDAAAYAGLSVPGATTAYADACHTVVAATNTLNAANAGGTLVLGDADYTQFNIAATAFDTKTTTTTPVTTYNPNGATGSITMYVYNQTTADTGNAYISQCRQTLLKADEQATVDAQTAQIKANTNALPYNLADRTYLTAAISDYNTNYAANSSFYTTASWSPYNNSVTNAKLILSTLTADQQSVVNNAVFQVTTARMALVYKLADTTELMAQIAMAEQIIQEQPQGVPDDKWNTFQSAYNAAKLLENSNITQQAAVDTAAANLRTANYSLSEYRAIDVTPLTTVMAMGRGYTDDEAISVKYTEDTLAVLTSAIAAGNVFITAYNSGTKNYSHIDEMQQIVDRIQNAINNLIKKPADYSVLNPLIDNLPDDDTLALYLDNVVEIFNGIRADFNSDYNIDQQSDVDDLVSRIQAANLLLNVYENYKSADYTGVNAAIAAANALNQSIYTNFEIVTTAINAVDWTKKIIPDDQDQVDAMAVAILDAINDLVEVGANYDAVDAAILRAENLEYPTNFYANYSDVQAAIVAVERTKTISQQSQVDAMAKRINDAIDALLLADANYGDVTAALLRVEELGTLTDYTTETFNPLYEALNNIVIGLKITEQARVDAMAVAINTAVDNMVLRPADFTKLNSELGRLNDIDKNLYLPEDVIILEEAVANAALVNEKRNIRQQGDVDIAAAAIHSAIEGLHYKPADYSLLVPALDDAKTEITNSNYTPESVQDVQDVIDEIETGNNGNNLSLNITQQNQVDDLFDELHEKVSALKLKLANYDVVTTAQAAAQEKIDEKDLYTEETMHALEAANTLTDDEKIITIDRQSEVTDIATRIYTAIDALQYAPADYDTWVNTYIDYFENNCPPANYDSTVYAQTKSLMDAAKLNQTLTKDKQNVVDDLATSLLDALNNLEANKLSANFDAVDAAVNAAYAKMQEIQNEGNGIGIIEEDETYTHLTYLLDLVTVDYYAIMKIDQQGDVDTLTQNIITATSNLQGVFQIISAGTTAIVDEDKDVIYGFTEGTTAQQIEGIPDQQIASSYFKTIGNGEIKVKAEPYGNGFGTGSTIQCVKRTTGEVIKEYTVVIFGDVNGDGYVDLFDAGYVVSVANMETELSGAMLQAADVNKDTVIDALDASLMLSLANMETTISQTGECTISPAS